MTDSSALDGATIASIRKNAELFISAAQQHGIAVNYDEEGIKWLDSHIEDLRTTTHSSEELDKIVEVLGSFLGECIRRQYGGYWERNTRGIAINLNNASIFPFGKVSKQLEHGQDGGQSVRWFYQAIAKMFPNLKKDIE